MYKVMKLFICRGCVNPVTGIGRTSVDIGGDANLELMDKFCYLGDMLSVDRGADAAVETRIRIGWNKFRQLVLLLTNKDTGCSIKNGPLVNFDDNFGKYGPIFTIFSLLQQEIYDDKNKVISSTPPLLCCHFT